MEVCQGIRLQYLRIVHWSRPQEDIWRHNAAVRCREA